MVLIVSLLKKLWNTTKNKFIVAYMKVAETFAEMSYAKRAKVGAIIVKDGRIISIGYNGMPSGWDNDCELPVLPSWADSINDIPEEDHDIYVTYVSKPEVLHAEANAIAKVAQSSESCRDAVLFTTHMPCIECAKLIHQSGIKKVYYSRDYDANKGSGKNFLYNCETELEQVL